MKNVTKRIVGNSAISAGVSFREAFFSRVTWNPPCFEHGKNELTSAGRVRLWFRVDDALFEDRDLVWEILEEDYPYCRVKAALTSEISIELRAFAPLSAEDQEAMFLPVICLSAEFTGSVSPTRAELGLCWELDPALPEGASRQEPELFQKEKLFCARRGDAFLAMDGAAEGKAKEEGAAFSLCCTAGSEPLLRAWFGCFPPKQRWRRQTGSLEELCLLIAQRWAGLEEGVKEWVRCLPEVGDRTIARYLRWYSQAAVLLTKADDAGTVITMGYNELNQRDSFWTSYVHLYFWPELEKAMLRESCQWQREDGKIPTTFLPVWEREVDIDINEYFCLRIGRYYRWRRDEALLRECWPHFLRAVDFLLTRDVDGDGLPEQAVPENPLCFWADWKDVKGVVGRKLAPHFALLWLAVLQEGAYLAGELGEERLAADFTEKYRRAKARINLPPKQGGLWSQGCYREVWYNGEVPPLCLQDQTVGMAFGVVDPDRAAEIYRTLERGEGEAGIPETFPFREGMEYPKGVYHNGGIWPFLTFCDCLGRYRTGRWREAERLIRKVGYYDLEAPGDWAPNEYLNGITLENCGFEIQGWSAALFGAITHGAFQVTNLGGGKAEIGVNFKDRDFETQLLLPAPLGRVTLGRKQGKLFCRAPAGTEITVTER